MLLSNLIFIKYFITSKINLIIFITKKCAHVHYVISLDFEWIHLFSLNRDNEFISPLNEDQ
jgi:hypothetical protein